MLLSTASSLATGQQAEPFLERLTVAVVQTAVSIGPEATTTANYNNRQAWVNRVLSVPGAARQMALTMLAAVITTAPVMTAIDAQQLPADSDILTTVSSLVNTFAGRL